MSLRRTDASWQEWMLRRVCLSEAPGLSRQNSKGAWLADLNAVRWCVPGSDLIRT
jgi:hypothetical protein